MGDPVAFETDYTDTSDGSKFVLATDTLSGKDAPSSSEYALTVGYRNYTEPVYTSASPSNLSSATVWWKWLRRIGTKLP